MVEIGSVLGRRPREAARFPGSVSVPNRPENRSVTKGHIGNDQFLGKRAKWQTLFYFPRFFAPTVTEEGWTAAPLPPRMSVSPVANQSRCPLPMPPSHRNRRRVVDNGNIAVQNTFVQKKVTFSDSFYRFRLEN